MSRQTGRAVSDEDSRHRTERNLMTAGTAADLTFPKVVCAVLRRMVGAEQRGPGEMLRPGLGESQDSWGSWRQGHEAAGSSEKQAAHGEARPAQKQRRSLGAGGATQGDGVRVWSRWRLAEGGWN